MYLLAWLFALARDCAVFAAAVGVAWWAWERHQRLPRQRDEEAADRTTRDRLAADMRQGAARIEALAVDISTRLDEILSRGRDAEVRSAQKVAIHKLLMATDEPFLTFAEIQSGIATSADPLDETGLRRCLMELAAEGVVAQIEHDRYFIASDFDADETGEAHSG